MVLASGSKGIPGARRALTLGLLVAGALALIASGAPAAWAGPAQEEYELRLPDARGGGSPSGPGEARSTLSRGGPASPSFGGSSTGVTPFRPGSPGGFGGGANAGNGGFSPDGGPSSDEALLAKARNGVPGSGVLSASTSAAAKTPVGLAVLAALLLIAVAGTLAARRRRAKVSAAD